MRRGLVALSMMVGLAHVACGGLATSRSDDAGAGDDATADGGTSPRDAYAPGDSTNDAPSLVGDAHEDVPCVPLDGACATNGDCCMMVNGLGASCINSTGFGAVCQPNHQQ